VSAWQLQVLRCAHDDTVFLEQRSGSPRGGGLEARPGAGPGEDACGQGSSTGSFPRVQANDMRGEMGEHVAVPDRSELSAKLGANGCAVIVSGHGIAGDPSPLPVREGAV
jgi:hypothetical protein